MTLGKRLPSTRTPSLLTIPVAAKIGLFNALLEYSEIYVFYKQSERIWKIPSVYL